MVDSPHKIYNSEILGVESAESLVILLLHFVIKQRPLVESIKRGQISNLAVIVVQMYVGIIQSNPQDFWGLDSKPQKSWGLDDRRDMYENPEIPSIWNYFSYVLGTRSFVPDPDVSSKSIIKKIMKASKKLRGQSENA